MSLFKIDEEKCKRDGICVSECPARIIEISEPNKIPVPTESAEERCINCGHCVAVCPVGAFSHRDLSPEQCPPIKDELSSSPAMAEQFLRSRRSIRSFKSKPVEREKLEQLLEIACCAPSAANKQPWHWLVIEDTTELRRLIDFILEWMRGEMRENPLEAPGVFRIVRWPWNILNYSVTV